jgi:D-alanyl-D-alanine carboxypeptidase/D-alanyl-D-alanine-endopeptidase (penicillin-binding protein 4)
MADRRWEGYPDQNARRPARKGRWIVAGIAAVVVAVGGGALAGVGREAPAAQWQGTDVGGTAAPVLPALSKDAPRPSPQTLAAILGPLLADGRLGGHVTASVIDVTTGEPIFDRSSSDQAKPASTNKLLTAAAVLHTRGPAYRIPTRAVAGATPGEVVLVAGGDVTLATGTTGTYAGAGRLDALAGQVMSALGGQAPTRVIVDSSLYVGPAYSPAWLEPDRNTGVIANITAIMTNGGRIDPRADPQHAAKRYAQPDIAAGQALATALGLPPSAVSVGTAPPDARQLGEVLSPPMSRLVETMLLNSDNVLAEALARQVAIAKNQPASFDGAAAATTQVLTELKLPVAGLNLVDGSGLSHADRVTAALLTSVLAKAAASDYPQLRPIVSGLPVAAYSGTLFDRYLGTSSGAAGVVRAKTGTLSGVNALAGLAVDGDGRLLAFSIVADATPKSEPAEAAIDRVAATVAACGCS